MEQTESRPSLRSPDSWDRYYQVNADLGPILGTPGLGDTAHGNNLDVLGGRFAQVSQDGFFLIAEGPIREDPVAIAADLMGTSASGAFAACSGMRLESERRSRTGTHLRFQQLLRGSPVLGTDVQLHAGDAGVYAVSGRPLHDIERRDPGAAPPLRELEALETCVERFELTELCACSVRQVVLPLGDGAVWAHEVSFVVTRESADARVYLHSDDLTLLLSYNVASAATGRASVYEINPLRSPRPSEVTLDGLDDPGSLLRGSAFDVNPRFHTRIESADADFRVDDADPAFDEPQVYYHLWRTRDYFAGLVAPEILIANPFAPLHVIVNDPESPDNAYWFPTLGELRFGVFRGDRPSARCLSLVAHEFGHAVTDTIGGLGGSIVKNSESRGLSEGYSDYFAASMIDDPRVGDYVAGNPDGARNCASDQLRFPAGFRGEEHDTGAVWAAVLWDLRGRVGVETADVLAIESLNHLSASSTFCDAEVAVVTVDAQLNCGANRASIEAAYEQRRPAE
jgi:hypothetical protein